MFQAACRWLMECRNPPGQSTELPMSSPHLRIRCALAALTCLVSIGAQAQITKCIDEQGRVSYSDDTCTTGVLVVYAEPDTLAPVAEKPASRPSSPMAIDNLPIRETAWATMPIAARHARKDAETVSEARSTLAANDRGLAAIRTQKLASR
jgi:hypothetical protein